MSAQPGVTCGGFRWTHGCPLVWRHGWVRGSRLAGDAPYWLVRAVERVRRVTEAKIEGAWNLHRATLDLQLQFFTVFSSIASVWGSGGMAHYAAANHFLDGLVAYRRQQGRVANAIQWGPWGGGGMAAGDAGDQAEKRGLRLLQPVQGVLFMRTFWQRQDSHVVVADVVWERFKELLEVRREQPLLSLVARAKTAATHSGQKSAALAALADKPLEQRAEGVLLLGCRTHPTF